MIKWMNTKFTLIVTFTIILIFLMNTYLFKSTLFLITINVIFRGYPRNTCLSGHSLFIRVIVILIEENVPLVWDRTFMIGQLPKLDVVNSPATRF